MKTNTNSAKKIIRITSVSLLLISLASCGAYKYDDSIYASSQPKERIVYIERTSNNNQNASEKKYNYFLDQAEQFENLNDKDVLVDIDSISSDSTADNNLSYVNGAPWEYTDHTTVNIYTQPNYYGGYGYYNYYNPYFSTPYYVYYDYYNPYYSNYYYYPSAYIGFGFPYFGGYFSYNPYGGYYNPYYGNYYGGNYYGGNYYGGRSYANYSKRVTHNTQNYRQANTTFSYSRNSNNFSNKNGYINNGSNKRNSTNTYSRNNANNNYNRNNTDKNTPVYKNNSNNYNSGNTRTNSSNNSGYKRNSGNSGGYKRNSNGNNQANINTDNHLNQPAIKPVYKRSTGFLNTVRRVVSVANTNTYNSYKRNNNDVNQARTQTNSNANTTQHNSVVQSNSVVRNSTNSGNNTVSSNKRTYHRNNN